MSREITIPAAALEAVFKVLYPYMDTGGDEKMGREVCADAIFAMLKAWPRMYRTDSTLFSPALIIPLTENPDAET